jgi:hypothetical protein
MSTQTHLPSTSRACKSHQNTPAVKLGHFLFRTNFVYYLGLSRFRSLDYLANSALRDTARSSRKVGRTLGIMLQRIQNNLEAANIFFNNHAEATLEFEQVIIFRKVARDSVKIDALLSGF